MGQAEICQGGTQQKEIQELQGDDFAHHLRVKLEALVSDAQNNSVDIQAPQQYSSLRTKLNRYGKEQLQNMLVRPPQPQIIKKRQQRSIEASKVDNHSREKASPSSIQKRHMRQLQALRQQCLRIGKLQAEMVKKTKKRLKQQDRKNQVHLHQQMFTSTDNPNRHRWTSLKKDR